MGTNANYGLLLSVVESMYVKYCWCKNVSGPLRPSLPGHVP